MSRSDAITRPELRAVRSSRYCVVPPPSDRMTEEPFSNTTDIVPPDDRSLAEWLEEWQDQCQKLRQRLLDKVEEIAEGGRQGILGLTKEAHERTPAMAVALATLRFEQEKKKLNQLAPLLASLLHDLQVAERREEVG